MSPLAILYGAGLLVTVALAAAYKSPARIYGALLLIAAWLGSFALENAFGAKDIPQAYQWMDFGLVIIFAAMGFIYIRAWAWWVSGFHVAMLFTHLAYQLMPELPPQYYLHVLAAFGYLSMIFTVGTPLLRTLGGQHGGCTSYNSFMRGRRLDSSYLAPQAHRSSPLDPGKER